MKVTVRKGPPQRDQQGACPVVAELWLTEEEGAHLHFDDTLCDTIEEAVREHMTNGRHRTHRLVRNSKP